MTTTPLLPVPGSTERLRALREHLVHSTPPERTRYLRQQAAELRRRDLVTIARAGLGHIGGDFSAADILLTLYLLVLQIDPEQPTWPERDRFIESKGHSSALLYATLARLGFFPEVALDMFAQPLSPLSGHPDRKAVPGVEASTGPLGHGLPLAVGAAIAAKLSGSDRRVFVLTGDGELQEGSNWEAAMFAAHRRLDNLTVIVDRNGLQQGAATEATNGLEPLAAKWEAFGWKVLVVDGHDHEKLYQTLSHLPLGSDHPSCVIAKTHKGEGVSFMADRVEWHNKVPDAAEVSKALEELQA